mgnify:CR=1 FL=1
MADIPASHLARLRKLPSVDQVLRTSVAQAALTEFGHAQTSTAIRDALTKARQDVREGATPPAAAELAGIVSAALTADAGSYSNAVTAQNVSSTLSLVVVSRFNGVNEAGTTVSTLYPGNATRDSLFGNTETFNGVSNLFPGFKLTGLDAQTTYSFTFYASRTGVGDTPSSRASVSMLMRAPGAISRLVMRSRIAL